MSLYKEYPPADLLLIGYDPVRDLPEEHLARLVDRVVGESITVPKHQPGVGQPPFNPQLPLEVLVYAYGYCIGVRSSCQMERMCRESLPFLLLTRGRPAPSYRTLCTTRIECQDLLEEVFPYLFAVAAEVGLPRLGRITVDTP